MREHWRQGLHLEPPRGWMNDPNGLCWFQGKYHVYFQYCPESPSGAGRKYWGHYESADLLRWRFTGIVLSPDHPRDRDGVYSGSAWPDGKLLHLFYTGNVKYPGDYDYITAGREGNVLHVTSGDGRAVSAKELLLTNRDYPADCTCHVRDPKVWAENGVWNMVLGARSRTDRGNVLLFRRGEDGRWAFAASIGKPEPFGYMWECPDYYRLDGRGVLSVSPQGLEHGGEQYQNVYQSGWFPVEGELERGELGRFTEWDMGFDFYAPQSFLAPDGRRLMIGWMGLPDSPYENPTAALGWQHCLTVPREIFWDEEGRLCQRPVRELEQLAGSERRISDRRSAVLPLPFEAEGRTEGDFAFDLDHSLQFRYHSREGLCELRFADARMGGGRTVRRARLPRCRDFRLLADASSLELYLDGGAVVFSTRCYPSGPDVLFRTAGTDAVVRPLRNLEITDAVR